MKKTIYLIGRQFGSGGRKIGEALAKKLEIPFYDKELIERASKESGIIQDLFERADETHRQSFLYTLAMGSFAFGSYSATLADMSLDDKLFLIQSNVIRKVAEEGSAVIVGRCADYVLKEDKSAVSVFLHAPIEKRIERISKLYQLEPHKAKELISKTDKRRSGYYQYYTSQKWGAAENFHLSLDTSTLSKEEIVDLLIQYGELKSR